MIQSKAALTNIKSACKALFEVPARSTVEGTASFVENKKEKGEVTVGFIFSKDSLMNAKALIMFPYYFCCIYMPS